MAYAIRESDKLQFVVAAAYLDKLKFVGQSKLGS